MSSVSSTPLLNTKNGSSKSLKEILFPAKIPNSNNIFTNAKMKATLKSINNANRKILKSESTITELINEIKTLYKSLDLGSTDVFLPSSASTFSPLTSLSQTALQPFKNLYNSIKSKVNGTQLTNLNKTKLSNISNIKSKINDVKGSQIQPSDKNLVKKLYQLYLILYYLNKLVNYDQKKLKKETLINLYNNAQKDLQNVLKSSTNTSSKIQTINSIINTFTTEIATNIDNTHNLTKKLLTYVDNFSVISGRNDQRTLLESDNNIAIDVGIFNLIFYAKKTIDNIFDYTFNYINGTPNKSVSGVVEKEVIKNVRNIDSRKVLLQLIKVLGKIMPEFRRKEFLNKLKSIKNQNASVINNLNSSLKRFLSK
jgi:hypothetical protein